MYVVSVQGNMYKYFRLLFLLDARFCHYLYDRLLDFLYAVLSAFAKIP